MLRKLTAIAPLALLWPNTALAFNWGGVRAPDEMDAILTLLLIAFSGSFMITVLMKPSGVPINRMYQHFGEFSILGRLVYAFTALSFIALMGLLFLGMGIIRAEEAGL
ncbi:hypothetical protein IV417_08295 [Alphaproteobacteria bacterium KMM 3653]|uniref:Uncharacterized protein n=1 Tax=Harenicola maris TaxID=2841044 RepID=A0AAP2CNX4_9RHOB|nr:hypothetical protein [Harenicola maris]